MAPFKKNLTPLSKGGAIHKHHGKGSQMVSMPNRNTLTALQKPPTNSINDYAKASPMPSGQVNQTPALQGFGSGDFAGNGI